MKKLGGLILLLAVITACTKEPVSGPCEVMPTSYHVSVFETPPTQEVEFFVRNYKTCKKRNLKRNPNALFNVGVSVLHGLGTTKDASKAFLWFKGAADGGHRGSQRLLADMFNNGIGVPRDPGIGQKYLMASSHPPQ